jgi:putative heme transporter
MTSAVVEAGTRTTVRWWRPAVLIGAIVLAVFAVRSHLPDPAATWAALHQTRPGWLLAAAVLQVISMGAFAEQQRHLLAAFAVRMPAVATLGLSYARSAISTAMPGGSAVSAGYTFRRYRVYGASQPVAAAVILLSGVASTAGLALLYAADILAWTTPSLQTLAVLTVVAALAAAAVIAIRKVAPSNPGAGSQPDAASSRSARLARILRDTIALARTVPMYRWLAVVALSALNWFADLACLLATAYAVGLIIPMWTVATAYLAIQLIRQIPVTPGGIGVIEAGFVVALTTAGAAAAPAAAAVLVYRLLSCWSLLPIGLVCWLVPAWSRTERLEQEPATVG